MPRYLSLSHIGIFLVLAALAVLSPAVGGEGDTIMHFFWAKHVWNDADALFRSWAKPFFTLFAAPSTLFGFIGIKLFNILAGVLASYITCLYALRKGWQNLWIIPCLAFLSPAFFSYLNTGLTEPFAALVLISCLYLLELGKGKPKYLFWAYLLISFLPFCRSEAQILVVVFLVFGAFNRHWKFLPLVVVATVFYSLVGSTFKNGDIFWVFNSPYVAGASVYGKGPWLHFFDRLNIMLGVPALLLVLLGSLWSVYAVFKEQKWFKTDFLLIFVNAWVFFFAHTVVWALGIYASAGLERVLIMVFPLFWLLALSGFNTISKLISTQHKKWLFLFIPLLVLSSHLGNERTKFYRKMAYDLGPYQTHLKNVVYPFLNQRYPDLKERHIVSDLPFLALLSNHNPLDVKQQVNWQRMDLKLWNQMTAKSLFVWDNHGVPFYTKFDEETLKQVPWLTVIKEWEMGGRKYILLEANENYPDS